MRRGQLGFGTILFISIGILLGIVILNPVIREVLLPWTKYSTEVTSAEKVIQQTYDANNAIYNYEWFKRQQEDIKATERQIDNTVEQQQTFLEFWGPQHLWDSATKREYNKISTTLAGQKNFYADLVAEYNARSQMANRAIFEQGLPRNIDKRIW